MGWQDSEASNDETGHHATLHKRSSRFVHSEIPNDGVLTLINQPACDRCRKAKSKCERSIEHYDPVHQLCAGGYSSVILSLSGLTWFRHAACTYLGDS